MSHPVAAGGHAEGHHVLPVKTLATVLGALLALTILTVLTAVYVDIGAWNVPLALGIAAMKAMLVITFFMALKYDSPVNRLVLSMGAVFVSVFLIFTLFDTLFRGDMGNVNPETIEDIQVREKAALAKENPNGPATALTTPAAPDSAASTTPVDSSGTPEPAAAEGAAMQTEPAAAP